MIKLLGIKNETFKIENKDNEDLNIIESIEHIFRTKRNYVIKMPLPGAPVVCCFSGGADSTAIIFILLKEFKLNVYPFFIKRGQSAYEYEKGAIDYYNTVFIKMFPDLYHQVKEISVDTPAREYKDDLRKVKTAMNDDRFSHNISYPARNSIIFLTGMEYAYSLRNKGVIVKDLFSAHLASDYSYHCSQTFQRITNLTICQIMHDWDWQFISLPIETDLGNYYDKDVLIKYCEENGFDLTQTRTCVGKNIIQCGKCPTCWDRRRAYKVAGVEDRTKYLFPYPDKASGYYD